MVFRVEEGKLYPVDIAVPEDLFLEQQKDGKIKFIEVQSESLPVPDDERKFNEVFFMLDGEKVVIDWERTEKKWIEEKYEEVEDTIYGTYPQSKQQSDIADKNYYETLLKAKGIENLEADIVGRAFFSWGKPGGCRIRCAR